MWKHDHKQLLWSCFLCYTWRECIVLCIVSARIFSVGHKVVVAKEKWLTQRIPHCQVQTDKFKITHVNWISRWFTQILHSEKYWLKSVSTQSSLTITIFSVRNKHRGNNFTITMVTALILHYLSTDLVTVSSLFSLHWPILLTAAKMFFQNYLSNAVSSQSYHRVWSSLACCAMFCIIYYYLPVCLYCLPFQSHLLFFSFSNLFWKHNHVVFCDQVLCLLELGTMP